MSLLTLPQAKLSELSLRQRLSIINKTTCGKRENSNLPSLSLLRL